MDLATRLQGTDLGSPHGVTTQGSYVHHLWHITYLFAVPLGLIVLFGIFWCVFRYRDKGDERKAAQFQYHIPIEAAYTIIPLVIVAIVFGFMFNAENKVDKVTKSPDVKITVYGFQWGWSFVYPNGHEQTGTVANALDINSNNDLPVLVIPTHETVQLHVVSLDVVHTFYVPEFLFQRDLIPGIDNTFDINVTTTGVFQGQCNNICGQYHAYMRLLVDAMPPAAYANWYAQQAACSITTAGQTGTEMRQGSCPTSLTTEKQT
jgi:cytochrome c oxidase subunit II